MTRHYKLDELGLLGAGPDPPPRIADVEQRVFLRRPDACPKCGNVILRLDGRRVSCGLCGWDAYWVSDQVIDRPRRIVDGLLACLLAALLLLPGCAAGALALTFSSIAAAGTGVGVYQTYAARQAETAKITELKALREEIRLLRKQLPNPPP